MNKMRRADRGISEEAAYELLAGGEYGFLATVCGDGQPYVVPLNYAVSDGVIYIHGTAGVSQRNQNMDQNPRVCFTVVGKTEVLPAEFSTNYESVVVTGTAGRAADPQKGLLLLTEKYSPEYTDKAKQYIAAALDKTAVYEIKIEAITGKARR